MKFIFDNLIDRKYKEVNLELLILQTPYDSNKKFYIHVSNPIVLNHLSNEITKELNNYSRFSWFNCFKAICIKYANLRDKFSSLRFSIEFDNDKEYKKFVNVINANDEKPINDMIGFGGEKINNKDGSITLKVDIVV